MSNDKKFVTTRLDAEIHKAAKAYAQDQGLKLNKVIEFALKSYIPVKYVLDKELDITGE